jgi:hypothetical protein
VLPLELGEFRREFNAHGKAVNPTQVYIFKPDAGCQVRPKKLEK